MKRCQSTQAFLGDTSFSQNEKLYQKKPFHLLDHLKYLPLNYQQNILENPEFVAAVASWKSKMLGLTIGRKSSYSLFQEHNLPKKLLSSCSAVHQYI